MLWGPIINKLCLLCLLFWPSLSVCDDITRIMPTTSNIFVERPLKGHPPPLLTKFSNPLYPLTKKLDKRSSETARTSRNATACNGTNCNKWTKITNKRTNINETNPNREFFKKRDETNFKKANYNRTNRNRKKNTMGQTVMVNVIKPTTNTIEQPVMEQTMMKKKYPFGILCERDSNQIHLLIVFILDVYIAVCAFVYTSHK